MEITKIRSTKISLLGLFVTWPTSYEALVGRAELKPGLFCLLYFMNLLCSDSVVGEWVLVTAAAGGVGIAATQLAKGLHVILIDVHLETLTVIPTLALGANVIAAAGSKAKLDVAKRYGGADHVVDYTKPNWQKEVLNITSGKGVDVIYDPVGMITGERRVTDEQQ
jgi:NADPH2:quinone reductase